MDKVVSITPLTHHHALELQAGLAHAQLELLHNVGDLLEPVLILVLHLRRVGYHQERRLLEENHFVRSAEATKEKGGWVYCMEVTRKRCICW